MKPVPISTFFQAFDIALLSIHSFALSSFSRSASVMSDNTRIVADHGGDACTVDGADGVRAGGCRRVTVTNSRDDSTSHVYCCTRPYAKKNVVFFGGDVQDFRENMLKHRDNKRFVNWSIEETADILRKAFPSANLWLMKAAMMHLGTFSVYSNFVESSRFGNPTHSADQTGLKYLKELLEASVGITSQTSDHSTCDKITNHVDLASCTQDSMHKDSSPSRLNEDRKTLDEQKERKTVDTSPPASCDAEDVCKDILDLPMKIVGFSKGCVVLNQFLYELPNMTSDDEDMVAFVRRLTDMYWLDGGHSGGSNTWVTDHTALTGFVGTNIHVHVHTTPYQMSDTSRPWIAKEKKKFIEKLRRLGVKYTDVFHFEDEERTIENHFKILHHFMKD